MTIVNNASLASLSALPVPQFDRSAASVGIVHIGFGNFHRSHEAVYLDDLMALGSGLDWGICGVGILPQDARMRDAMTAQDCLYSLIVRNPDGSLEPRIVGSVLEYVFGPDDPEAVYERLLDPKVAIVSLTVTEGGYLKNAATGQFDPGHASVVHDLAHPQSPETAFAYIVEALKRRKEQGMEPFTVLSCDNLQGNGDIARQTVVGFARLVDPSLAEWIDAHVAFPNCMVDRITPGTTDADIAAMRDGFGVDDIWPVPAEPFTQWIVEDHFTAGRPDLERVGVQFVEDVKPYELMKLRLLNASHQALAYFGAPLGYVLVDEAMRDDRIRDYLVEYMASEAAPTLGDLPGIDLEAYMATLIERFSNPAMRDTLKRLATDGSNRMATFTLPAIRANLEAGRDISLGAAMVAAWAHYWSLIGRGELPEDQIPDDVHAAEMTASALALTDDPAAFIKMKALFGDMAENPVFRNAVEDSYSVMAREGVGPVLEHLLGESSGS